MPESKLDTRIKDQMLALPKWSPAAVR